MSLKSIPSVSCWMESAWLVNLKSHIFIWKASSKSKCNQFSDRVNKNYSKALLGSSKCVSTFINRQTIMRMKQWSCLFNAPVCGTIIGIKIQFLFCMYIHSYLFSSSYMSTVRLKNLRSWIFLSCHSFFIPTNPDFLTLKFKQFFFPLMVLLVKWIPEQIAMGRCIYKSTALYYRSHSWKSKWFPATEYMAFFNVRSYLCVYVYDFPSSFKWARCAHVHSLIKCSLKLIPCTKCQIDTMDYK